MDKDAIHAILQLAPQLEPAITDIPAIVMPATNSVVSLEGFMDAPNAFKGHFETHLINEFVAYADNNQQESTAIYIDTETMSARAIFDHGDPDEPQWGNHRATLALSETPAYHALAKLNTKSVQQQHMIDFIEDWQENIEFFDSENQTIGTRDALNRIRRITVSSTQKAESERGDFNSSQSAMESIEVTAGTQKLPAYFVFITEPYEALSSVLFRCNLRAFTDGKTVGLMFRIEALDRHIEAISNEFRDQLKQQLAALKMFIGTMEHR